MGHRFYFLTSGTSSKAVSYTHDTVYACGSGEAEQCGVEGALINKTIVYHHEIFIFLFPTTTTTNVDLEHAT